MAKRRPEPWEDGLCESTSERTYADVFTNDHVGEWARAWMAASYKISLAGGLGRNAARLLVERCG